MSFFRHLILHFLGVYQRPGTKAAIHRAGRFVWPAVATTGRQALWREGILYFLSSMDKTALVQTLVMSEKTQSIVRIKIFNNDKLIEGAVQKVLNQMIILKSTGTEPITLTFGDIESVKGSSTSVFRKFLRNISKTLRRSLRWECLVLDFSASRTANGHPDHRWRSTHCHYIS